jgi:hypothetical protein
MSDQKFSPAMWLQITSKSIANYAAAGGRVEVVFDDDSGAIAVYLDGIEPQHPALHDEFKALIETGEGANHD